MVGRELVVKKDAAVNLREVAARATLREVRQKGHAYVELRHAGKRVIFFCTICLTPCYSDTVLFDHLKGNLHARRLAAAKVTLYGAIPWPFNDGVLFFDSSHEPNLLLSGSHCQNDMALVVTKNTGTDGEVTSKFRQNSDGSHRALCLNEDCSDDTSRSNVSKSKGSADAKVSLGIGRHKSSTRSSPSILDKISICCWSETSLIIPGVVLKEELANLTVRHLGVGQIAYRMHDNKESPCRITRIWCAWMGQGQPEISDELKTSENCDFAIVNFPYAYGLGRKHALDDEELLVSAGSFFEIDDSGNRRKRKRKSFSDPEDRSESHSGCSGSPSGGSLSLDTAVADDPQQLESQLISSKAVRRELRKQKRLAAERTCDICGQPMLPGKDVATLLNCRTGNLACSSRNTNGVSPSSAICLCLPHFNMNFVVTVIHGAGISSFSCILPHPLDPSL